jgi:hypothetical protein
MPALTQCWYTRAHRPAHVDKDRATGVFHGKCRYCGRAISSWNRESWHLSDGFNIEDITRTIQERFLYLVDTDEEFVIARFTVAHLQGEDEIAAYRAHLHETHCTGEAAEALEVRDSRDDAPQAPAPSGRSRRKAAEHRRAAG